MRWIWEVRGFWDTSSDHLFSNNEVYHNLLEANLELLTYWWICSAGTGFYTFSTELKETYLDGSNPGGAFVKTCLFLQLLTSVIYIETQILRWCFYCFRGGWRFDRRMEWRWLRCWVRGERYPFSVMVFWNDMIFIYLFYRYFSISTHWLDGREPRTDESYKNKYLSMTLMLGYSLTDVG